MGKVTISYEFDSYEEATDIRQLLNHKEAFAILWDVDQSLRTMLKHGDDKFLENEKFCDYLEGLREMIHKSVLMLSYE